MIDSCLLSWCLIVLRIVMVHSVRLRLRMNLSLIVLHSDSVHLRHLILLFFLLLKLLLLFLLLKLLDSMCYTFTNVNDARILITVVSNLVSVCNLLNFW